MEMLVGAVLPKIQESIGSTMVVLEEHMSEDGTGCGTAIVLNVPVIPEVIIEPMHPEFKMPTYASEGDSGMDVYAVEDIILEPGETKMVTTGFRMAIPRHPLHELGYRWEAQARPKSGISSKTKLRVANAPGTVDNFYRGEVQIILTNTDTESIYVDEDVNVRQQQSIYAYNLKGGQEVLGYHENGDTKLVPEYSIVIHKGDKIAQLVFNEVIRPMKLTLGEVSTDTDRGEGGFGSTGLK